MNFPIVFSKHALKRMKERHVFRSEVIRAIEEPIEESYNENVFLAKSLRNNGHLLLVAYSKGKFLKVITVIDTSKIKKYFSHD